MKVFLVGTGVDGKNTLTNKAAEIIENSDLIIGANRIVKPFSNCKKKIFTTWDTDEIVNILKNNSFENAAVLLSGDTGFFSLAEKLSRILSDFQTEIICGISSVSYFFSKLGKPWQNAKFITLHGRENSIARNTASNEFCFFLLGGNYSPSDVCQRLNEFGLGEIDVYIGENLGYENEKITHGKAKDLVFGSFGKLCVILTENKNYEINARCGIPDEEFIRGKIPMTKSEIRALVISKLQIKSSDVCWDIGGGTGSVTVEMALQCAFGKVYSVEKNHDAVQLIRANSLKFSCDNVEVAEGKAPEILDVLPPPDRVFIGGTSGKINEILDAVLEKNPYAKIVATAISIETVSSIIEYMKSRNFGCREVIQAAVSRSDEVRGHTMLRAENPIFIVKGALK